MTFTGSTATLRRRCHELKTLEFVLEIEADDDAQAAERLEAIRMVHRIAKQRGE